MTARAPAEDAIFMLQANEIHVVGVQEVGGPEIRVNILLRQLKSNTARVGVAGLDVVDRQGDARGFRVFGSDGLTQVGSECGYAALARRVVTDKRNAADR